MFSPNCYDTPQLLGGSSLGISHKGIATPTFQYNNNNY